MRQDLREAIREMLGRLSPVGSMGRVLAGALAAGMLAAGLLAAAAMWAAAATLASAAPVGGAGAATTAASATPRVTLHRPLGAVYDLYLGGVRIGELSVEARMEGGRYRAASAMRTAGIVGAVYDARYAVETEGEVAPGGLVPRRFTADTSAGGEDQAVDMVYAGGRPAEVRADPPFKPKPWEIEPRAQAGTIDPLTAALLALAPAPRGAICDRTVQVYDGRRRYQVALGRAVEDGERLRCPLHYRRLAGYKPKELKVTYDLDIWFEERADGLAHVVRVAGDSQLGLGLAVMLLRE